MGRGGRSYDAKEALEQLSKGANMPKGIGKGMGLAMGGLLLAGAAYNALYTVQGGFRAIKFNMITGLDPLTYGPGTHFKVPLLESPIIFDVRQQPISIQSSQGSRDLQVVNTTIRILFKSNENNLQKLYRQIGPNYQDVILPSIANEVLKSVIAQYNASELITKRPEVSRAITNQLSIRAMDFFIDIMDVSIVQMNFGKEYTAAVESKQIAQQMAERAKFMVEQAEQEKKGVTILAEGEAESARLIGQAVKQNQSFLDLRRMEAAKEIATTLARSPNKVMLDSDSLLVNLKPTPIPK
ncbi:Prohibitin-6 [Diplonema papillatum]|nr:Prohibitin-6 [Diplonema papillatum]